MDNYQGSGNWCDKREGRRLHLTEEEQEVISICCIWNENNWEIRCRWFNIKCTIIQPTDTSTTVMLQDPWQLLPVSSATSTLGGPVSWRSCGGIVRFHFIDITGKYQVLKWANWRGARMITSLSGKQTSESVNE